MGQAAQRLRRLDSLVDNATPDLLGPVAGAEPRGAEQMITVDVKSTTLRPPRARLPPPVQAAGDGPRLVADVVNISSVAGRIAWSRYGVCGFTSSA